MLFCALTCIFIRQPSKKAIVNGNILCSVLIRSCLPQALPPSGGIAVKCFLTISLEAFLLQLHQFLLGYKMILGEVETSPERFCFVLSLPWQKIVFKIHFNASLSFFFRALTALIFTLIFLCFAQQLNAGSPQPMSGISGNQLYSSVAQPGSHAAYSLLQPPGNLHSCIRACFVALSLPCNLLFLLLLFHCQLQDLAFVYNNSDVIHVICAFRV